MNFELISGGVNVTCRNHDAERMDALDRKAARNFPVSDTEQPGEVDAFCAALSWVPSLDYVIAKGVCPSLPLPRGFGHFRLFTPGEREPFHRTMRAVEGGSGLTSQSVLYAVLCSPCSETTAWMTTARRPVSIPGVLDLEVDIVSRQAARTWRLRE